MTQPEPVYRKTFIYGLVCPISNIVRYVGKANNPKYRLLYGHLYPPEINAKNHKTHWIKKLLSAGKRPELIILEEVSESSWQDAERRWIAHFRSIHGLLTNSTSGGDGTDKGTKHTQEAIQKIRAANLGKTVPAERREKIRISNIKTMRERELRIGTPIDPAVLKKISESSKTAWANMDPEKRRLKLLNIRHGWSDEMKRSTAVKHIRRPKRTKSTSRFRGVSWFKRDSCWRAWITVDKRQVHLGYFDNDEDAARAYDAAALIYRPDVAIFNFPKSTSPPQTP